MPSSLDIIGTSINQIIQKTGIMWDCHLNCHWPQVHWQIQMTRGTLSIIRQNRARHGEGVQPGMHSIYQHGDLVISQKGAERDHAPQKWIMLLRFFSDANLTSKLHSIPQDLALRHICIFNHILVFINPLILLNTFTPASKNLSILQSKILLRKINLTWMY